MDAIYPYVLVVHLLCAIIFIGYLFFDGVIFPEENVWRRVCQ